jgi:hypothetical protein
MVDTFSNRPPRVVRGKETKLSWEKIKAVKTATLE